MKTLPSAESPSDPVAVDPVANDAAAEAAFVERANIAIEFLEAVREQRALLASLGEDKCARLLRSAGEVARPDPWQKRELSRAVRRRRRNELRDADERALAATGIRKKRAEQVFMTPMHRSVPVAAGLDIDAVLAGDVDAEVGGGAGGQARERDGHGHDHGHGHGHGHGHEHERERERDHERDHDHEHERERERERARRVVKERACYVCKRRFTELHFFYDSMCGACGDLNWQKRRQTGDLSGRVALVTGSRVKIGYQAAIMLLRAGARVIVTTRFPRDAASRYAREPDFAVWGARLQVHGLDLRHTPSVEAFARHLCGSLDRLDFILNNACQTVRRPPGFYRHLMDEERQPFANLSAQAQQVLAGYEDMRGGRARPVLQVDAAASSTTLQVAVDLSRLAGIADPAGLSQLPLLDDDLKEHADLFPAGQLDADLQQIDHRERNSWRLSLTEVPAIELLEVQLVNAVAPFMLNSRLKPLMLRSASRDKHIVNVSAMEGQFYRSFKTDKHPHTNMAKAALNMMTRTSAGDYVKDGIHMNSVDTGWVTDEDVSEIAARKTRDQGFHPPLDIVDGAARICDPIFSGFQTGKHIWGQFLKDYSPTDW